MFISVLGDLNTGGIVAGVIVFLLLLILLGLAIWYAFKRGYIPSEYFFWYNNRIAFIAFIIYINMLSFWM